MDYKFLAEKYGTPLFVYDMDDIKANYLGLKNAFAGRKSLICFAVKANSNLSILKFLADLGAGFDCVSFNEVRKALTAGAKPYQVIYSGVGKTDEELSEAIKAEILYINVESYAELKRLENIAQNMGKEARISIRVNPNINPKTHPYISTGLSENKFGVSIDEARKMYLHAKKSEFLSPIGIHFHIGSQLSDVSPIFEASEIISNLLKELKALEIDIKFYDVGGGIGITYKDEPKVSLYDYAQGILGSLKGQDETIVLEPGRFLVGNAGVFLTKVLYEKTHGKKRFIIVDGAMNDVIRPSLYGAYHEIYALNDGEKSLADVVGPICESGDFLGKNVELPSLNNGDILVVKSTGAYCMSMASNYNSRCKAAEVAVQNDTDRLIRKRDNFEDLIANEKEFL